MTKTGVDAPPDDVRYESRFYRCCNAASCGLRFPVTVGDKFHGVCPRCGSEVQLVAREAIADDDIHVPSSASSSAAILRLLLDNWRSVFNVGAAFRTADGAGLGHLYLCGITATPESQPKLAKTALGAEKSVAWSYHPDAVQLAELLQRSGVQIWALERDSKSQSLFDITFDAEDSPVVLAAGNELAGVDPALVSMADRVVHLPMVGSKQSLNVAVALSIAAYCLRSQALATPGAAMSNEP